MPILPYSAVTRKHTVVGQKYFKGREGKRVFGEQKYTTYNKINNNSENFRRSKIAAREGFASSLPLVAGLLPYSLCFQTSL